MFEKKKSHACACLKKKHTPKPKGYSCHGKQYGNPQKLKTSSQYDPTIPLLDIYIKKTPESRISAYPCSQQHFRHEPRGRSNQVSISGWVTERGLCRQWNITQPRKGRKGWHMRQHGWTMRTWGSVSKPVTEHCKFQEVPSRNRKNGGCLGRGQGTTGSCLMD